MDLKKAVVLSGFALVMMAAAQIALAEDEAVVPTDTVTIPSNQQGSSEKEGDIQWAWGEVVSLDNPAQTITLKYLDYETDQEKELVLVVDEKTVFENIKDFNQLKEKDTLSIDYMNGADNRNVAQNIIFEKPEDLSPAPVSASSTEPPVVEEAAEPVVPSEASVPVEPAPAPAVEAAPAPAVEAAPDAQGQAQ